MSATDHAYKNARRLRRELSLPEKLLWVRLRSGPVRFRRQHPIGPYVLDFYCPSAKLAIEVDGAAHDFGNRPERDDRRGQWLEQQGVQLLRIAAKEVLADPDAIANALIQLCTGPLHHRRLRGDGPPPRPLAKEELTADATDVLLPASEDRGEGDRDAEREGGGVGS